MYLQDYGKNNFISGLYTFVFVQYKMNAVLFCI